MPKVNFVNRIKMAAVAIYLPSRPVSDKKLVILKVLALLKFAILGLPKLNFVFATNSVLLLLLLIGYILDG